jgi:hypothetical protein
VERTFRFFGVALVCLLVLGFLVSLGLAGPAAPDFAWRQTGIDVLAHTLFALSCAAAYLQSAWGNGKLEAFDDFGSPSLRTLALIAPVVVAVQMLMGAALRQRLMGPISHVAGAMLAGAFVLYYATGVLTPSPKSHPARTTALVLLWTMVAQIVLGIAAYSIRTAKPGTMPDTLAFTAAHVAAGSLVMGATIVLSLLLLRTVRQPEAVAKA